MLIEHACTNGSGRRTNIAVNTQVCSACIEGMEAQLGRLPQNVKYDQHAAEGRVTTIVGRWSS
jgi:hypothetical protein